MFGLFKKKSMEDLMQEKADVEAKLRSASSRAAEVAKKRQVIQQIAQRKQALSKLNNVGNESLYHRIKSKTSPVIRGIEGKVKKNLPSIRAGLNKVGEGSHKMQQHMTSGSFGGGGFSFGETKKSKRSNKLW